MDEYTIASEPIAGTEVVRRLKWPGPFGLGHRYLYLVRKHLTDGAPPNAQPPEQKPKLAGPLPGAGPGMM